MDSRRRRHRDQRIDLQRVDPGAADDLPRGRLYRADAEERAGQRDGAQYRLPRVDRRARRRRAHPGRAGPAGGAALEGDQARHLHLSLRAGRGDDPLPRGLRHERGGDGAAQGRAQGPRRQGASLRPGLLRGRAGFLRAARRRGELQEVRDPRRGDGRGLRGDAHAHPEPRGAQRQGGRAHRRRGAEGQGRRERADRPLPGQPRFQAAPDRRSRRLCLGGGLVRRPAGGGARDLVHPRRLGRRGALHLPAHLRC